MNGSGTVRVVKRDGTEEAFDVHKLAAALFRAMRASGGRFRDADQLAQAIGIHLRRCGWSRVSSAAIFEMAIKVLRRCRLMRAAESLQSSRTERRLRRSRLRVRHHDGRTTLWDKSWLGELAQRSWFLSPRTGRLLAGEVEGALLGAEATVVSRQDVLDMLNERVAQYGLADAVPVRLSAGADASAARGG